MESSPHSPQLQKACAKQGRPSTVKNFFLNFNLKNKGGRRWGGGSVFSTIAEKTHLSTGDKDPYRFQKDKNRPDAKKFSSQNIYLSSRLSKNMMERFYQK